MKITITEPVNNKAIHLDATPANTGWRIDFPDAPPLIITQETGVWTAVNKTNVNPELINRIGIALHPIARYTRFSS